jgi:C_GCAxxG_C_C family probable redox protein
MKMTQAEKQQLITAIMHDAHDNSVLYWGCSQATLSALQKHLNLGTSESFKAVTGLAGGVGLSREVCGAVSGAVVAISLVYGRSKYQPGEVCLVHPDYIEGLLRSKKLCDRFKEKFGSLRCADVVSLIRGADWKYPRLNTIERMENRARCGYVNGMAAAFAAEIILEPRTVFKAEVESRIRQTREDLAAVEEQQKLYGVDLEYLIYSGRKSRDLVS